MKTSFQAPSTDPSPLYGRVFEKWLRDKIFATACKELGLDEADRDDYVGTEYYVLRTIDDTGRALLKKAVKNIDDGMGEHSAFAPLLDFKDMVNRGSYFPVAKSEKPAAPKTTPVTPAKPAPAPKLVPAVKTGETLGDQLGADGVAELQAAVVQHETANEFEHADEFDAAAFLDEKPTATSEPESVTPEAAASEPVSKGKRGRKVANG